MVYFSLNTRRKQRLEALAAAKAKIAERVQARDQQAQKDFDEKVTCRQTQQKAGQKPRDREPKTPEIGSQAKDQINLTDEQSRIKLILEALDKLEDQLGKPDTLLTDNGYFSQDNVKACAEHGITPLIALGREAHHLPIARRLQPDTTKPQTDDPLVKMTHQLKTQAGGELYSRRKCTVEPVFDIIKQVLGFRQFLMRGLQAAAGEWKLATMAYNFKRMFAMTTG